MTKQPALSVTDRSNAVMTVLAAGVAAMAAAAFGLAVMKGAGAETYLFCVAAAICAVTTYRATRISSFLRIFCMIFAAETILFGAADLLRQTGAWPASLAMYRIPESLPLTVAIFAILAYAISFIPTVRIITRITDLYFDATETGAANLLGLRYRALERRIATAMVVFLVVINQAQVGMTVRLSFFNRDWFNAIQARDAATFWHLLFYVFTPWAFAFVAIAIVEFVVQSMLLIRWRRWLTEHYVSRWLDGAAHYRMTLKDGNTDNPDQRIAEDVRRFIDGGGQGYGIYSYSILLISTLSSLVSFAVVLWGLSANFTIPGLEIAVPGLLFWIALVYAIVGTLITHWIGRPLVQLLFERQRREADFRFSLARLREYSEQVALLGGEPAERASLGGRFGAIITNYLAIVTRRKKLLGFTATYGQISPIIPYIFTAPFYFLGKIQLGAMTQTAGAFDRVQGALTFFVDYYVYLADFRSVVDRLVSFDASIEEAVAQDRAAGTLAVADGASGGVKLTNVELAVPGGPVIVRVPTLALAPGEATLVAGPSGSGKSTLFRAIAGIWPYGAGRIERPDDGSILLLPQKPYLPSGALRDALAYPHSPDAYDDATIRAALIDARLPHLASRLDEEDFWQQRLSGGEQQRVAIARALLARPAWLFLDEATAALDEETEAAIYALLAERLPHTTIVSIGHRSTLRAFHARAIEMRPDEDGVFTPRVARAVAAA